MPMAGILALNGCYASSLGGFADVLQVANAHLRKQHGGAARPFQWRFISLATGPVCASNGLPIAVDAEARERKYDLIFIPSLHYSGHRAFDQFLKSLGPTYPWLVEQWRAGALLAANCTGTFVLARTGLLDGRVATTTWWLEQQFRARYPNVKLEMGPVVTEVDRLMCGGASASYLLQAVRVVEKFCGTAIASQTAKAMLIDVSQTSQTPYLPLLQESTHSDELVRRAQAWLAEHLADPLRLADLASFLAVSERTLIRRFNTVLREPPLSYLQKLRIDSARAMLETGTLSIERISNCVGYRDTSSFSRLFRERIGVSPGQYRTRFQFGRHGNDVEDQ